MTDTTKTERDRALEDAREDVDLELPPLFAMLADNQIESVCDAGLRHRNDVQPNDYLVAWLKIARQFAYATQDDSWGELEKELCIVFRRLIIGIRKQKQYARALIAMAADCPNFRELPPHDQEKTRVRAATEDQLKGLVFEALGEPDYKLARWSHGAAPFEYWTRESIEKALRALIAESQRADELEAENKRLRAATVWPEFADRDDDVSVELAVSLSYSEEKVTTLTARVEKLEAALVVLERAATNVSRFGACPGAQWVYLTGALLNAREALKPAATESKED